MNRGCFSRRPISPRQTREASLKKGAAPVILFNGESIVRLMIERGVGVERTPLYAYQDVVEELMDADSEQE